MTQSSAAITARGIRKSFGEHTVLDRILSTLIPTDAGTIRVAGHDLAFFATIRRGSGPSGSGNG
jgi:ABC-type transporter Mla maintaining outer membrane lipid asymmetry ATPase subunit MlaF